jgi:pimeloyl-ACP methyl ester carboxylesterase
MESAVTDRRRRRMGAIAGIAGAASLLSADLCGATALSVGDAPAPAAEAQASVEPGSRIALAIPGRPPVSLYYEERGEGDPILLLHGLGESTFTWHDILPALSEKHRVIALDLKGFGRSEKPDDGAYSADDQAALVARFIIEKGLEGVTLIGHSFGGAVALRTALADGIQGTKRVRRIAVISSPGLPGSTARHLDLVKTPVVPDTLASALPAEALARLLLFEAMGRNRDVRQEDIEGYAAPYRDPAAMKPFFATARAIVTEEGKEAIAKRYKSLKLPVLAVWCRKDPIVPLRAGRRLVSTLPNARLVVLEGCHHLPQHEQPKKLLKVLGTFLNK